MRTRIVARGRQPLSNEEACITPSLDRLNPDPKMASDAHSMYTCTEQLQGRQTDSREWAEDRGTCCHQRPGSRSQLTARAAPN